MNSPGPVSVEGVVAGAGLAAGVTGGMVTAGTSSVSRLRRVCCAAGGLPDPAWNIRVNSPGLVSVAAVGDGAGLASGSTGGTAGAAGFAGGVAGTSGLVGGLADPAWNIRVNSPGPVSVAGLTTGGTGGTAGEVGFAGGDAGTTGSVGGLADPAWNIRVNSPGAVSVAGLATGGTGGTAGAAGFAGGVAGVAGGLPDPAWNIRVNSPGPLSAGAAGFAGGVAGVAGGLTNAGVCIVSRLRTGGGGLPGPAWNIFVNSPGPVAAGADGAAGFAGGAAGVAGGLTNAGVCIVSRLRTGGGGLADPAWNIFVNSPGPVAAGADGAAGWPGGANATVSAF